MNTLIFLAVLVIGFFAGRLSLWKLVCERDYAVIVGFLSDRPNSTAAQISIQGNIPAYRLFPALWYLENHCEIAAEWGPPRGDAPRRRHYRLTS